MCVEQPIRATQVRAISETKGFTNHSAWSAPHDFHITVTLASNAVAHSSPSHLSRIASSLDLTAAVDVP